MTKFIECDSAPRGCKVLLNMDEVLEIAPLASGGCELFFFDATVPGGRVGYKVKDHYTRFLRALPAYASLLDALDADKISSGGAAATVKNSGGPARGTSKVPASA